MRPIIELLGQVLMLGGVVASIACGAKGLGAIESIAICGVVFTVAYFCLRLRLLSMVFVRNRGSGAASLIAIQLVAWAFLSGVLYLVGLGVGKLFS